MFALQLKRHNQVKNNPKAYILFSLLDMFIICEHVHILEYCGSLLNFWLLWQRSNVPKAPFISYSLFSFILDMHF